METYERVRQLRKDLKMSQEKFGAALGVGRVVIKNIELNLLARPEQKEPLLRLICETFNVSYEWLTTGQGEMYDKEKLSFVEKLSDEFSLSVYGRKMIECYLELDEHQQATIDRFLRSFVESCTEDSEPDNRGIAPDVSEVKLEESIDLYRAANSEGNTAPEIIHDETGKIERFKSLNGVTKAENL